MWTEAEEANAGGQASEDWNLKTFLLLARDGRFVCLAVSSAQ